MMNVWGMTDIGLVRRENQDSYAIHTDPENGFTVCVVCDGMGGPGGGKLASQMAVETFLSACKKNLRRNMSAREIREVAEAAVAKANSAIYRRACSDGLLGMGTTLVSAVAWDRQALLSNVGDSRAYVLRTG
ncbi:MAG: protein phosphatase 2C domain-containing protein, partial [Oscillospiraceae bacterium]|nr:protein phosphatase 2C domain-containing protein [Oscillospiraceae bacterium]